MNDPTILAIPFFAVTMLIEAYVLLRHGHAYETRDTLASLSGGVGSLVVKAFTKALQLGLFYAVYEHRLFTMGTGVAAWIALIFAEDLCFYLYHRASHEIRIFWAGHVVHHSSERYTLATALRQSWTSPLYGFVFWLPLPLLGFRPEMVMLMSAFSLLYQYWIHTEEITTLGPLEWVMNTPSHHRVHHGSNPQYIDKNHAGIFIVWDRLFGTFAPEGEKVRFGITKSVGTFNPVTIQVHEFVDIARDIVAARSLAAAWHALTYMPPAPGGDQLAASSRR